MNKLKFMTIATAVSALAVTGIMVGVATGGQKPRFAGAGVTDACTAVINNAFTRVTGTSYTSWKQGRYVGQSAGGNESVQLRSTGSNSGIVTIAKNSRSYNLIRSIVVDWNNNTANERTIDIYGRKYAYTSAEDLYETAGHDAGEKLGSIVYGTSTRLEITKDYSYVGLRSNYGALYLNSITFNWSFGEVEDELPPVTSSSSESPIPSSTDTSSDTPIINSIVFADKGLENSVQYTDPFVFGDYSIQFAGGGNDGKYYTTGAGIRTYGGGTITITSAKTINTITFVWDGSNKPGEDVASPSGYATSTGIWSGSANTVTLTRPSGSGHWRLKSVTVN